MELTGGPRKLPAHINDQNELRVDSDKALRDNLEFGNYFIIHTLDVDAAANDTVLACRNDGDTLFCIDRVSGEGIDVDAIFALHIVTATYTNAGLAVVPVATNGAVTGGRGFSGASLTCTNDETGNTQGTQIKGFQNADAATGPSGFDWEPVGGLYLRRGMMLGLDVVGEPAAGTFTYEGHFVV